MKTVVGFLVFILIASMGHSKMISPWQQALDLAQKDKNKQSLLLLEKVLKSNQKEVSQDEVIMTIGRVKYQAGDLDGALETYSHIPKSSDFWLNSLEERAWTYIRQNKFEKALSLYHTLTAPAFSPQVGPETYLIGTYASLRTCDYKSIFEIFEDYKKKYKQVSSELEALKKNPKTQATEKSIQLLTAKKAMLKWSDLGADVAKLPQFINRDDKLLQMARANKMNGAYQRIQMLAANDLNTISKITRKLHIVEVEAIQRMNLKDHNEVANNHVEMKDTSDTISFPKEQETWLDEITHYQVKTEGCKTAATKVGKK